MTTWQSPACFIVMIGRYAGALVKIRNELRAKHPRFADASGPVVVPTLGELTLLMYLETAVCETVRLNLVAPMFAQGHNGLNAE